jgi:periplasmic divalent cation tolerance protein
MLMTEAILVLCTCPNEGVATLLASEIVEQRLAACVNVVPLIHSIYSWQNKIEQSDESQLLIKTRKELFEPLRSFLRQHHPYETPEIMALPVLLADADYLNWIADVTR